MKFDLYEITSMDLNDRTIASLQLDVSSGLCHLKLQTHDINFESCSAQRYFKNLHRNPFQSASLFLAVRPFVFAVLLKCPFTA